jgi:hypothetical protein
MKNEDKFKNAYKIYMKKKENHAHGLQHITALPIEHKQVLLNALKTHISTLFYDLALLFR